MITFHAKSHGYHIRSTLQSFKFPGGECHLKGHPPVDEVQTYAIIRGADANELLTARMWVEAARQLDNTGELTLYIPYLPGARADRGTPFGAKDYADLINMIGADKVVAFDAHSEIMPALVDNLTVVGSARTIRNAVTSRSLGTGRYTGVIAPDKGAVSRAAEAAAALHLPLYRAEKNRDFETGKILGITCEPLPEDGTYLVVDDICDGGGTFAALAQATGLHRDRLGLYVSHGIFSGNAAALNEHYSEIITTDSHPGAHNPDVAARVVPILPNLIGA
ncbi:phosphoribosyltransferase family protein [Agromyces humi]|uniref:phosphoribosyltransferase family protein n=1 Tax=Agromyces humi TaxID=1766800 RepID=UPI00135C57FE|nr:phosphoribosyltransferase family protein [Agromyces humi]